VLGYAKHVRSEKRINTGPPAVPLFTGIFSHSGSRQPPCLLSSLRESPHHYIFPPPPPPFKVLTRHQTFGVTEYSSSMYMLFFAVCKSLILQLRSDAFLGCAKFVIWNQKEEDVAVWRKELIGSMIIP